MYTFMNERNTEIWCLFNFVFRYENAVYHHREPSPYFSFLVQHRPGDTSSRTQRTGRVTREWMM